MTAQTTRTISEIAGEILLAWPKVNPAAAPYLDAMLQIHGGPDTKYYAEDGRGIVAYFLSNASTFKGEDAKRIKAELKKMIGLK